MRGVNGPAGKRGTGAPSSTGSLVNDALYPQLQDLLQEGRWREAQTVLTVLARRHNGVPELARWQEFLEMRLSAEATWGNTRRQRLAAAVRHGRQTFFGALRRPAVRGLLVANVVVYLLLAVVMLLQGWGYLPWPGMA